MPACLAASDPLALALVRMGEIDAAGRLLKALNGPVPRVYAKSSAQWATRIAMRDARILHALTALARAVRLECRHREHASVQPAGRLLRHCVLIVRLLLQSDPGLVIASELRELDRRLREILEDGEARSVENALLNKISSALDWGDEHAQVAATSRSKRPSGSRLATRVDLEAPPAPPAMDATVSRP